MLFPGWGQGRHCSCSPEPRGDRLHKPHLIFTYMVLGHQLWAGWDPQGRPVVSVRTMVLAQPTPPLTPAMGPTYVLDWARSSACKCPREPAGQAHYTGGEKGSGLQMHGDLLRGTRGSKGTYSSVPFFCASSRIVPISSRLLPESKLCSLLSASPWRGARPREGK